MVERHFLHEKIREFLREYYVEDKTGKIKLSRDESKLLYATAIFYNKYLDMDIDKPDITDIKGKETLEKMYDIFASEKLESIDQYWLKHKEERLSRYWEVYYFLGECYLNGYGTEKDIQAARVHLQAAVYSVVNNRGSNIKLLGYEINKENEEKYAVSVSSDWSNEVYNRDYLIARILESICYFADIGDDEKFIIYEREIESKNDEIESKENEIDSLKKQIDELTAEQERTEKKLEDNSIELQDKSKETNQLKEDIRKLVRKNIDDTLKIRKQEEELELLRKIKKEVDKFEAKRIKEEADKRNIFLNPYGRISEVIISSANAENETLFEQIGTMHFGEIKQGGRLRPTIFSEPIEIKNTVGKKDSKWLIVEVTNFKKLENRIERKDVLDIKLEGNKIVVSKNITRKDIYNDYKEIIRNNLTKEITEVIFETSAIKRGENDIQEIRLEDGKIIAEKTIKDDSDDIYSISDCKDIRKDDNNNITEVTVKIDRNGERIVFPNPINYDFIDYANCHSGLYDIKDIENAKAKLEQPIEDYNPSIKIIEPCIITKQGICQKKGLIEFVGEISQ